ncbi:MAG TPA: type II toxin-antitoxin system RelE/ParE family toxin [Terriglobales bacterium]|nr:type II toxin-antitoxin system RelE/ParE family toxin [Terriglobales bacterium]
MTLRWTHLASDHLRSAWELTAADNPAAADRVLERIMSAIEMLQIQPYIGRKGRVPGTRELVVSGTPFVLPYRLRRQAGEIEILAVLHGARRWPQPSD